jgi:outer membrane receptor protein involved in Fe transport
MKLFYTLLLFTITQSIFSQTGIISGSVVDESSGSSLPGVNVTLKELKKTLTSDSDGKFIFRNIPVGIYELEFRFTGYETKAVSEVNVIANETTSINASLNSQKNVLDEVVITRTKAKTESVKSLLIAQKNSANVSDGISAETIKRTPDKNTSDVLKRISGASIQDNRFVIVRGLNDRYNAAFLNGAPLPSSESDRKAFSFDIFPSNMLDNLIITKTASPDLPGDFAGGVVQINTKSVPDKDFQTISIGTGYNTITTGKTQKTYKGSGTDWLGFDNGTRALPSTIPNTEVFSTLGYQERVDVAKSFQSDWNINNSTFAPNYSFQYSIGHHFDIKDKTLGIMFSVSNNKSNNFNTALRNDYDNPEGIPAVLLKTYNDRNYSEQVLTAALANFSLKFNDNHSLSFKNILSLNSTDLVVERSGLNDVADVRLTVADVRWFTSSKIYSGQLNGEHYFSKPKIKLNWTGFYSDIKRDIPNLRRNIYTIADPDSTDPAQTTPIAVIANNNGGPDYGGGMFWAENKEFITGGKIDISRKFSIGEKLNNEIKIGGFTQYRERDFFARQLQYNTLTQPSGTLFDTDLLELPNATIFNVANMGPQPSGLNGFTLFDFTKFTDTYFATSKLHAGYLMLDNRYKKFRLIWGVRFESFTQTLDARETEVGYLALNKKQNDVLPSVNLIYAITSKQNLRISYSKTLNRPEYRELAPFGFYDFTTQFFTQGNPNLKIATVKNFDLRYEFYPGKGQLLSVSYFRKNFTNPIELKLGINNKTVTYENADSAVNSGIELEFRTLLSSIFKNENTTVFDDITLFANTAIIKSVVDITSFNTANTDTSVPLQGQSPFVVNVGLQYLNKENGWVFSSNLNRVGNRIAIAANQFNPALWEKGRTMIDFQVAKSLMKNKIELKLNIQNVLAQDQIFYLNDYTNADRYGTFETLGNYIFTGDYLYEDGYNPKYDTLYWRLKYAPTFSFSMTYNF